jgi:hypothetical protein
MRGYAVAGRSKFMPVKAVPAPPTEVVWGGERVPQTAPVRFQATAPQVSG